MAQMKKCVEAVKLPHLVTFSDCLNVLKLQNEVVPVSETGA
ncbi:hypothetical protein ACMYR2_1880 [Nitrobacter sp. TKz-YC01]